MIKEIILSSMLAASIGVSAVHYDQALSQDRINIQRVYSFTDVNDRFSPTTDFIDYQSNTFTYLSRYYTCYARNGMPLFTDDGQFTLNQNWNVNSIERYKSLTGSYYQFTDSLGDNVNIYPFYYLYSNDDYYRTIWFVTGADSYGFIVGGSTYQQGQYDRALNGLDLLVVCNNYLTNSDEFTDYEIEKVPLSYENSTDFVYYVGTFPSESYYVHMSLYGFLNENYTETIGYMIDEGDYQLGYDTGYDYGYNDGYENGVNQDNNLVNLFLIIADIPIRMIYNMTNFDLLGVSFFVAIMSIATLPLIIWIIRKIINL